MNENITVESIENRISYDVCYAIIYKDPNNSGIYWYDDFRTPIGANAENMVLEWNLDTGAIVHKGSQSDLFRCLVSLQAAPKETLIRQARDIDNYLNCFERRPAVLSDLPKSFFEL